MRLANFNVSEDHSQYVGQVYQEHCARLRHYFLTQLGDVREAESCVNETFRHFFFFMEDRDWETEAEFIRVYLMRIAGRICSRRLGELGPRRTANLNSMRETLFNKVRTEAIATMKERLEFIRAVLRPVVDNGGKLSEARQFSV